MSQLRDMSVFAHIVEQGSITAAAERLDVSKSVVSQSLKSLESDLGVTLLKRTTRRQTLTAAGERFFERSREINRLADAAWCEARNTLDVPQGRVRITGPNALMATLLAPAMARVIRQYPLLEPELVSTDQHLDILASDIDLAIRVGPSETSALKQRRIGGFRDVLCGRTDVVAQGVDEQSVYIANTWQGQTITHRLVHQDTGETREFSTTARCKADSFHTCLALIREGAGIGLMPDFLFETLSPELREVFPEYHLGVNSVYALHPYADSLPLNVAVCLAPVEEQLR